MELTARERIIDILTKTGKPMTLREIAEAAGEDVSKFRCQLSPMHRAGILASLPAERNAPDASTIWYLAK